MSVMSVSVSNMCVERSPDANRTKILAAIANARAEGSSVLVLPEMCLQGYVDFNFPLGTASCTEQKLYYEREAETIPGPMTDWIQESLSGTSLLVQVGLAESTQYGNVIYNSVALLTADRVVGVYRKTHNQGEWPYFNPGQELPVFETPVGRVGALICYDICFPEAARALAVQGAELILMSTAWPMLGHARDTDFYGSRMDLCVQANAFFNQVWIAVSNHCERGAYSTKVDYYGGSQIVNPRGEVVARSGSDEEIVSAGFDTHQVVRETRARDFFGANLLQDRRPDVYAMATGDAFRATTVPKKSETTSVSFWDGPQRESR
jgi:predicted amidohydrolase